MSEVISQITENNKQIESNLNLPKENNGFEEMKNYILTLENKLKNQELENFNLKNIISQKEQEKLNYKQNIEKQENKIQELTSQLENYKFQLNKYQNKINEIENENRTLNYNIIELTQKNKSLLEKESYINNKNELSNQHLSISNRLDEIEIIKSKLEFDNTKLINKIKDLQYEYDNQITLLTKIKNGEIEKLEKVISSLHELINNNIQQNALKEHNTINNQTNYSQILIEQISGFELKVSELNNKLFNIQKENINLKNQINKLLNDNQNKNNLIQELKQKMSNNEGML